MLTLCLVWLFTLLGDVKYNRPAKLASAVVYTGFCSSHAHYKVGELTCAGKWGRSGVVLCPLREDLTHTFSDDYCCQ